MKSVGFEHTVLTDGYWYEKEKLNREVTVPSVYEQFERTGRIRAFACSWREGDPGKPHYFWDSDVAKWIEGAAYILTRHPAAELEKKIDAIVENIRLHQGEDGYFNIYFTAVEPSRRFRDRDCHELYCAGHLIEAAIACDRIGKPQLLACMKKYVAYIRRVFVEEKSSAFATCGHEEIELALLRLYRHTGEKEYLDLAAHFINIRGTSDDVRPDSPVKSVAEYDQSHLPVREQSEAVGHSVRALYLYTAMAMLAKDTGDSDLFAACRRLFENITEKKAYITGGVGSTAIGEAFTNAYDLPNASAYAETCAAIALTFFCRAMWEIEPNAVYADWIERALYNGVLSGLSTDGSRFFYVNALEIDLNERFEVRGKKPPLPITQRPEIFGCSCCPPNLNRVLAPVGGYLYGLGDETVYVNQYAESEFSEAGVFCRVKTDYPRSGRICVSVDGSKKIALRIPSWCEHFTLNLPYERKNGYAVIENVGTEAVLELDLTPRTVYAHPDVAHDAYRCCVCRGPIVYCAEGVDNGERLHRFSLPMSICVEERTDDAFFLPVLDVSARYLCDTDGSLYASRPPETEERTLRMIPYACFANRGESDMRVWFSSVR